MNNDKDIYLVGNLQPPNPPAPPTAVSQPPLRVEGEDIEALEAVPEVTLENVEEMFAELEEQNEHLVRQLGILGKGINPLMVLKLQVDTLIDFTFADEEARRHYETACSLRLNETLKLTLAQLMGASVQ